MTAAQARPADTAGNSPADASLRRQHIIGSGELARLLTGDAPPLVLDIRFHPQLADPRQEFDAGHLPGAHYVHLPSVLADAGPGANRPAADGALPLPAPAALQSSLRALGVDDDSTVVVYDNRNGLSAARGWWVLRWAGVASVRVLDGGYAHWVRQGLPTTVEPTPTSPRGSVVVVPGQLPTITTAQAGALPDAGILLDAREEPHFGAGPAAHIPGALNLPSSADVGDQGLLLPEPTLRARAAAAGIDGSAAVGAYCGAGVLAAHKVLTLATLGIESALYVGSFSAWSAVRAD
ncbi:sulfurtransferase [Arthrobacter sp. 35W]|uniref:sulfurtransferase n=1 Tax=Arthrobacter sp. 35W TaxID=1132441 RepID=UPI00041F7F56|nr:rhodanese-like domain-containing protein [Arthrobacter sp. 35W]